MRSIEKMLRHCELCPMRCGADRLAGETGVCGAGDRLEVYAFLRHDGEEPAISGRRGSGVVFFSRCPLKCIYCQNFPWSQEGKGTPCEADDLAAMFRKLRADGCHNWNLVSPTPWLPWIVEALDVTSSDGRRLPVVFNSSGYERVETLKAVEGNVDVYLVDLRYSSDESALAASGAADYVVTARAAIEEMWRQVGPLKVDPEGAAVSGMICRILILPGHEREARENLAWIAERLGTGVCLSVMAQYTPAYKAAATPPWNRRITRKEYESVCAETERLGFSSGWIQDCEARPSDELMGFNMRPSSLPLTARE